MKKSLLILMICLSALPVLFAAENLPVRRFGIYVGANNGGSKRTMLQYAVKDAKALAAVMEQVGGISSQDGVLLSNPSKRQITLALSGLESPMKQAHSQAKRVEVLFYYSGHSDEEGLLLGEERLPYKEIRESLQALPADVKIAILDSCSSGAFARTKGGTLKPPFLVDEASKMTGHAYLTSSSENEASQESDKIEGSFFTHYLVSGLRGAADATLDGRVTLNEIYQHAFHQTLEKTESTQAGPQHPSYDIQLTGTGDLVLTDINQFNSRLRFADELAGRIFVKNERGMLAAELAKPSGSPMVLALPEGLYNILITDDKNSYGTSVRLAAHEESLLQPKDFKSSLLTRHRTRGTDTEALDPSALPPTEEEQDFFPFGLSFVPGLGTYSLDSNLNLNLNILVGLSKKVDGVQASGIISIADGRLRGGQFSGVAGIVNDAMDGFQGSGVFGIVKKELRGGQGSGVFNIMNGPGGYFQGAGVFNIANQSMKGFQGAGVFNIAGSLDGFQGAGVFNISGNMNGMQASVVNVAGKGRGVQLGLVNINSDPGIITLGLVNITPASYLHGRLWYDHLGFTTADLQWGGGPLYLYYALTGSPGASTVVDRSWGAGLKWEIEDGYGEMDLGITHRHLELETVQGKASLFSNEIGAPLVGSLRGQFGLKVGFFGLLMGVSTTWALPEISDADSLVLGKGDTTINLFDRDWFVKTRYFFGIRI